MAKGNLTAATPPAGAVTDAMRAAPIFTAYDLTVHLAPAQASLSVEARVTLRNGGEQPLGIIPLQLSSSLHVDRVSLAGVRLPVAEGEIASDADHTGKLEETAVTLPQPLAPGASVTLSVAYGGTIEPSTGRGEGLGATVAARSEWDRISEGFTGLRGFGEVVWYPVCSLPALVDQGARLAAEIDRQRARNQDARIAIAVTEEFTGGAPTVALLAGQLLEPGKPEAMPSASFPGVVRFEVPAHRLGFGVPNLFVASRMVSAAPLAEAKGRLLEVYATAEHAGAIENYQAAAGLVEPLLTEWLGARANSARLGVIDLPVEGAAASEEGEAVLLSLIAAEPGEIAPLLSRELAHAAFQSPRVWLEEGVPALLGNLFVEQAQGRAAALEQLAAARGALALIEPESPGVGEGQSLIEASAPIYYRAKSLYVLSMLRDVAGDQALSAALQAYDPARDTEPEYFERLVEKAGGRDLRWFFDAWVYHDTGLPDLSIANVYSSRTGGASSDQWMVSVDVANDGYAEAEVPVTVRSAGNAVTERVRMRGRTKVSHRLLILGEPTSVEVNDGTVPEVQASVHQRLFK